MRLEIGLCFSNTFLLHKYQADETPTKTTPPSYENLNKLKLMHVFELSSSEIKTIFWAV